MPSTTKILICLFAVCLGCSENEPELNLPVRDMPEQPYEINGVPGDFMGCIEVTTQRASIRLWETSTPDRDGYILYLNDKDVSRGVVPPKQDAVSLELDLDYFGYNRLTYYAINYGQISRNSVNISVNGVQREVRSTVLSAGYLDIVFQKMDVYCHDEEGEYSDVMFWSTSSTSHCSKVPVILTGNGFEGEKSLEGYYYNVAPDCGSAYCATFENLPRGTYTYRAGCDGARTGTIELSGKPECIKINLFLL